MKRYKETDRQKGISRKKHKVRKGNAIQGDKMTIE